MSDQTEIDRWKAYVEVRDKEIKRLTTKVEKLARRVAKLEALEAAGVDNWEGYDEAMDMLEADEPG